jgi:hypothetical protein
MIVTKMKTIILVTLMVLCLIKFYGCPSVCVCVPQIPYRYYNQTQLMYLLLLLLC